MVVKIRSGTEDEWRARIDGLELKIREISIKESHSTGQEVRT